jgi:response regulator RpfG family c-di-GMP phosphodiesterase
MSTEGVAGDAITETEEDVASIIANATFPGWFGAPINETDRVGEVFRFPPFGWTLFVTEHEESFYRDVAQITYSHTVILVISLVVAALLVSLFVSVIVKPIERLSATMRRVQESGDLSRRAQIEYADEVGLLATEFNTMTTSLEKSYAALRETARAEEEARQIATVREEETLLVLGRATEFRDADTGDHVDRVGTLCALLMRLLGGTEDEETLIRKSAPLHDIGKIGISDTILLKPGKLTPEEFDTMKQHTLIGWNILKDSESIFLRDGARIALSHHEKWDGTGYPTGTSGEDIPLSGRIVGIVDVFDALTSVRPYKSAWDPEDARKYILDQRGAHFDPRIVDIFDSNYEMIRDTVGR